MKLMIPVNCIFVLYALALYWSGEVLDALFWMSSLGPPRARREEKGLAYLIGIAGV